MPKINLPSHIEPKLTDHALKATQSDRYGHFYVPKKIKLDQSNLVELEMEDERIVKLVVRVKYNLQYDLTLVIRPGGVCVTCWLNMRGDNHNTLKDLNRFSRA